MSVARTGNGGARRPRTGGGRQARASVSPRANPQSRDNLASIPGLLAKHRSVLAELQITTFAALARADPQTIVDAMSQIRAPRPSLQLVREWRAHAQRIDEGSAAEPYEVAAAELPDWERAATFVLSFEQRQVEGRSERQLVAQQAEQEVEQAPTSWPTWDTRGVSDWLRHKLADVEADNQASAPQSQRAKAERTPETRPGQPPGLSGKSSGRGQLRIRLAAIADKTGRVEVVSDDRLTVQTVTCTVPGRLEVQVAGAQVGRNVHVALRFARTGQPGWSPHEPTTASAGGKATIELTDVPTGRYQARILAWTPTATADHVSVGLGILSIQ